MLKVNERLGINKVFKTSLPSTFNTLPSIKDLGNSCASSQKTQSYYNTTELAVKKNKLTVFWVIENVQEI